MEQDYLVFMISFFSVSFLVFNLSFGIFIVSLNIRYFLLWSGRGNGREGWLGPVHIPFKFTLSSALLPP